MLTISLQGILRAGFHSTDKGSRQARSLPETTVIKEHCLEPTAPDTQVHIPALWRLHAVFFILHLQTFVPMSNTTYVWKIVLLYHTL